MKIAKERKIFDNYDGYTDEEIIATARECEWISEDEEPTDNQISEWKQWEEENDWDCVTSELENFFDGKKVIFFGKIGLWHGIYSGSDIGNFMDLFYKAIKDCAYIKIYDVNGHFHISCAHHDGSHHFEVKEITDSGIDYYDRWQYGTDNRKESQVNTQIIKRYSRLPHFIHKVWGCKAREYEESTKGNLIDRLNNEARSFYS